MVGSLKAGVIRQDLLEVKYPPAAFAFFFSAAPGRHFPKKRGEGLEVQANPHLVCVLSSKSFRSMFRVFSKLGPALDLQPVLMF